MRPPTILCWYTSTFLSFHLTSAAPGGRGRGRGEGVAVAIDFGAVTEKFPLPDASQQQQQQVVATTAAKTLQREQKSSKSQRPEPVRLWIDDFGNIEAVPVVSKDGLDDDDSSSSSSTEKSAPGGVGEEGGGRGGRRGRRGGSDVCIMGSTSTRRGLLTFSRGTEIVCRPHGHIYFFPRSE